MLAVAGCRGHERPLDKWTSNLTPAASSPAFDELLAIGREAEAASPKLVVRTDFYPSHKKAAAKACAPLIARLARIQRAPLTFAYRPAGLETDLPARKGWRLIGRVLAWQIADAAAAKAWPSAIERWRMATRFGFDLTGGGAADATLGLAIADDARRAIAPALREMPASSQELLASRAEAVLKARPILDHAVHNEAANMLTILQYLQDAYASDRLPEAAKPLGPSVADDVDRLVKGGREKAVEAFRGIGEEIKEIDSVLADDARRPARARKWEFEPGAVRGRMFRRAIVGGVDSLLGMNDATLARTRLLVAECRLRALALTKKPLPRGLDGLCPTAHTDPYSGDELIYRRDGKEWSVYSVGPDGKDDGGQTDAAGNAPDLRLER